MIESCFIQNWITFSFVWNTWILSPRSIDTHLFNSNLKTIVEKPKMISIPFSIWSMFGSLISIFLLHAFNQHNVWMENLLFSLLKIHKFASYIIKKDFSWVFFIQKTNLFLNRFLLLFFCWNDFLWFSLDVLKNNKISSRKISLWNNSIFLLHWY